MKEVYYNCLSCGRGYFKQYHRCSDMMCVPNKSGIHYDFCEECVKRIVKNFEDQMLQHRRPKLRLEGQ